MKQAILWLLFVVAPTIINANHFFHITDVHFDPLADGTQYLANNYCRSLDDRYVHFTFDTLTLFSVMNPAETIEGYVHNLALDKFSASSPGYFGRYGCDSPESLIVTT